MSKDVTFESEKLAKREWRRKWIIPAAITLGIVLIVLAVILILSTGKKKYTSPEGLTFPYTWTENKDTITLEIDHTALPEYVWNSVQTDQADENAILTVAKDARQSENSTSFTLKAMNPGRMSLDFVLQDAEGAVIASELNLLVEVVQEEEKLTAVVLGTVPEEKTEPISVGEDTMFPYKIYMENRSLVIEVTDVRVGQYLDYLESLPLDDENDSHIVEVDESGNAIRDEESNPYEDLQRNMLNDWECICSDETLMTSEGILYNDEVIRAYVSPLAPGSCEILFRSAYAAQEVYVSCTVEEDGSVTILSHQIRALQVEPSESGAQ